MGLLDILNEAMKARGPRPNQQPQNMSSLVPPDDIGGLLGRLATMTAPVPVAGDVMGLLADSHKYATEPESRTPGNFGLSALGLLPFIPGMAGVMTYHGTPHKVDRYDLSRIGTGEGAQAYGRGMYFAEKPEVAKEYQPKGWKRSYRYGGMDGTEWQNRFQDAGDYGRAQVWESIQLHVPKDRLLNTLRDEGYPPDVIKYASSLPKRLFAPPGGLLYKQDLPDEVLPSLLQWDKPLTQQSAPVKDVLKKAGLWKEFKENKADFSSPQDTRGAGKGSNLLAYVQHKQGGEQQAAEFLQSLGIPGISYFDQMSRDAKRGTRNHVIWDQGLLDRMKPIPVE